MLLKMDDTHVVKDTTLTVEKKPRVNILTN